MKKPLLFPLHTHKLTDLLSRWSIIPMFLLGMISNGFAQAPGGVTGASVWLKANAGTSTTTDGSTIATWSDQSGNNRTHTQPLGTVYQPLYKDNVFNYNPAVYFDGLDGMQVPSFASGSDAVHVFAMSKVKDNGWRSIYGFGRDATHVQWYNGGGANKPSWWLSGNTYPSTALGLNYGVTSFVMPKDGSQKTVHWNGTSANVAGINNYSYNSTLMAVGTDISNGGFFSENFYGEIAEVIIYKKVGGGTMSTTDIQKIQSYLGIKYGVTLSHNYLDAAGATIYNVATYGKNVFGIARDDAQSLYQKQSKSYDENAYVSLSKGALTTSNANNTGTLANGAFELIGDNGLDIGYGVNYAPSTFTPTTAFYRMSRIWKVQETGTVGTVRMTVPTGADRMLVSNSATFTPGGGTQELTLTPDGNGGQYVDIDLANGAFFTFGKSVGAPGCVAGGLNLWLKADFGTNSTTDGQDITQWEDASGNGNTHTKLSTSGLAVSPEYKANSGFNFNPSVYFDGGYNALGAPRFASGSDTLVVFAVSRADNATQWGTIYSFDRDGTHPQWRFGRPGVWLGGNYDPLNGAGDLNLLYGINTFNLKKGPLLNTSQDMWWNGNKTTYTGNGAYGYNATNFWLGNDITDNGLASSEIFQGDFMELAVYKNSSMTDAKIRKVQSYFGIKYGITVNHDYISGTDLNIWNRTTNTGFNNNIFGMGRDDCQDLNQKQSQSYTDNYVTIGNNGTIATTNPANTSAFSADKSFEIIGDNGLTKDYAVTYAPTTFTPVAAFSRMNRVWKVQETGTVGMIVVRAAGSPERLLVSSSATFGAGTQEILMTSDGNGNMTAQVDLTNGQFFTFGKTITAPGCVTTGLQYWFDASESVTGGASNVTAWTDKNSGVTLNKNNVGTITSSPGDAQSNFNPYVLFPANAHLTNTIDPVALGRLNTTFVLAQKDANIDATYNHAFRFGALPGTATTHDYGVGTVLNLGSHYPVHHWLSKGTTVNRFHTAYPISFGKVGLYGARINSITSGSNKDVSFNGNTQTYSDNIIGNINANMQIGGSIYGMQGRIPEVVYYNVALSDPDRNKVDSYFGVKYGLTLTHNYFSGAGTTIYDIATYGKNITGIGRDDCQDLNQKQSKSVESDNLITIGIDNQIAATNASNLGAFDTDKSFLIIGDDGAAAGTLTTVTPGGACTPPETVDKFTSRIWKSVESGTVESAKLSVDLSSYGFSTVNPVYMQVSSDAAFTSFSNVLMVKNGVNYETNYDFTGTQYLRFAGTTALPPANACSGDKTYEWNSFPSYWTWGQMSRTSTFGDTQFAVTITDPNGAIYAPSVYPVGQWWWNHIFIPRYDANGSSNKITTKIVMDKAANKASFEIFDIDEYFGKDVVNVYGKLGGVQVNPKITFPANSPLTVTTSGTGAKISATTGIWDITAYGKAYVNFNSAVDEIIVEYTKDNGWAFKSYQDIRIRNIDITCKAFVPEAPLADNVYMSKQVVGGTSQKVDEAFTYKFTVTNLDCGNKTINILDGLPSGLTFVDSTLATSLASTSVNTYGGTSSLNMTGVVVPPGTSYIYVDAKGSTAGTYDNQADFTVGSNSYLSDDPAQTGATNPTPVTLVANRPLANLVITKTVDKATAAQNEVVKYTYKIDNPNATAILTTFQDNLPASTAGGPFKYVAGSLTNIGSAIVTPAVYGGESSLTLRNLSIPASGSLTFTVDANTSTFTSGQTGENVASVTPDPGTIYRDIPYYSGKASTLISACSAGSTAPTLTATTKSNVCPATTADISSLVSSACPVGSSLEWHTVSTGLSASNKVANPATVLAGTYYPVCFDATGACYSPVPATGVTVTVITCGVVSCTGTTISSATIAPTTGAVANTYVVNSAMSIVSLSAGGGYTDASTGYRFGTPTATTDRNYKIVFSNPVTNVVLHLGFINNDIALNSPNPAGEEAISNITAVGASGAVYNFQDFSTGGMQNLWNPTTRTVSSSVNSFGPNSNSKVQISSATPFTEITLTHDYIAGTNPFGILLEDVCYEIACPAGTVAPTLSATTKSNVCPATTADISSLVSSSCPAGSSLEWHTVSTGFSAANKVANPATVLAGTYYPVCYDVTNTCYSPAPATGVTVTINSCGLNFTGSGVSSGTVTQSATPSQPKSGNAATELAPTGGTPGYTYSNGSSDPLCVAPVGATALPASSNLVVNSNGSYSYTAPTTPGTYYFCVKVCDSSTPTPICSIATYKVTVAPLPTVTFGGPGGASPTQTANTNEAKSGNAATELAPTGGTAPYTYTNGSSDPLCTAPVGATALPASSNLVVNSNGTYTYTAPATPGTYYFCVKVCDSTSPTPVCAIATYKVIVSATCAAGSAIPVLKN